MINTGIRRFTDTGGELSHISSQQELFTGCLAITRDERAQNGQSNLEITWKGEGLWLFWKVSANWPHTNYFSYRWILNLFEEKSRTKIYRNSEGDRICRNVSGSGGGGGVLEARIISSFHLLSHRSESRESTWIEEIVHISNSTGKREEGESKSRIVSSETWGDNTFVSTRRDNKVSRRILFTAIIDSWDENGSCRVPSFHCSFLFFSKKMRKWRPQALNCKGRSAGAINWAV